MTLESDMSTVLLVHRRLSMVTIFLASLAFLLVTGSIAAFIYVTRKEKILRRLHLIAIGVILFMELMFFIAVLVCCVTQSRGAVGQILAALLIILSLLALMILIYFLLEDILKDKIEPYSPHLVPFKTFEIQKVKSITRQNSNVSMPADDIAIPISSPPTFTPFPRLPSPPLLIHSPSGDKSLTDSSMNDKSLSFLPEQIQVVELEKVRQELLSAIDGRIISRLEQAIQQVKDNYYTDELKYDYERALELLNRLVKIEHMKMRVLRLNQAIIAELHSYTKPPEEVSTVMRATLLLLGHAEKDIHDWSQMQNLLGRLGKESVRRRCYELNPLKIPFEKAREAKSILKSYDLLRVTEISVGLAAFYTWAMTMIEEREKLMETRAKNLC